MAIDLWNLRPTKRQEPLAIFMSNSPFVCFDFEPSQKSIFGGGWNKRLALAAGYQPCEKKRLPNFSRLADAPATAKVFDAKRFSIFLFMV